MDIECENCFGRVWAIKFCAPNPETSKQQAWGSHVRTHFSELIRINHVSSLIDNEMLQRTNSQKPSAKPD